MQKRPKNSESQRASWARYQRRRKEWLAQLPEHHTEAEWSALKQRYGYRCVACGAQEEHVCGCCGDLAPMHQDWCWRQGDYLIRDNKLFRDHIIPLSQGGSDAIDNIQPLCYLCNTRKGSRTVDYRSHFAEA